MIAGPRAAGTHWRVGGETLSHPEATALASLRARVADASAPVSLLRDQHASELARRLRVAPAPSSSPRIAVLRSFVIDAWVRDFLARHAGGTVVEIGAGLSTRFERVDNGAQRWLDVDLPAVVALRRAHLRDVSRRAHVAASALDAEWSEHVAACPGPHCFVLEAVLAYLPPVAVPHLLARIVWFPGALVVVDPPRAAGDAITRAAHAAGLVLDEEHGLFARRDRGAAGPPYRIARFRAAGTPPRGSLACASAVVTRFRT